MLYESLGLYHNQERILSRRTSSSDMRVNVAHSGDGVEDGWRESRLKTGSSTGGMIQKQDSRPGQK